jgi:hypothetical protein
MGRSPADTEGGAWTRGIKQLGGGVFNRNVEETAAIGKIKDNILGPAAAMGEAKLAGDTIQVGNGGMAGTLESFTAGVRGEDGGLE